MPASSLAASDQTSRKADCRSDLCSWQRSLGYARGRWGLECRNGLDFQGTICRHTFRPTLKRIECNNADGIIELTGHEIGDDSFEARPLDFGFAVHAATSADSAPYGAIVGVQLDLHINDPPAIEPGTH
jgi:hypothetical protein